MAAPIAPPPSQSRRVFLARVGRAGATLATGAALASCTPWQRADERPWAGRFLTVVGPGGATREALRDALYAPFAAATGCQVLESALPAADLSAELRRQVLAGRIEWDVVALDAPRLAILARGDPPILSRLAVPSSGPAALREVGVAILDDPLALALRVGPFDGRLPATWAEAWDAARFPGPRAFPRDPVGLLEIALLADAVPPDRLYPLDLDRALRALDRARPAIRAWWREAKEPGGALTLGQADLALARAGDLRAALDGGALAALAPLPQPALTLTLATPQGAPNADVARDFLARATAPTALSALAARGYGPPGATANTFGLDLDWWAENGADALARFDRWVNR